jgi:uncharacterized glyoxalase superfamily protein PhnB
MTTNPTSAGSIQAVVLDCARPPALAGFYCQLLGGEITESGDEYAALKAGGVALAFQRVPAERVPAWPGGGRRVHLDIAVPDLQAARKQLVEQGAVEAESQPGGDDWIVLLDPEGHPFCIMAGE